VHHAARLQRASEATIVAFISPSAISTVTTESLAGT